jgi:hypothetical protein
LLSFGPKTKEGIAMLRSEMQHMNDSLIGRINQMETKLLQAFYGFAESIRERHRSADDTEASLKKRLTIVEERLTRVEFRLNPPPQQ